jgi:hypothetical protein
MMETKSSMQEQAPLRNADPQVGLLRRRFFAFAIAALAAAIFISLYLGVVKTTALPSELATARSDFETMAELASKAADETAQLRKTAEAATAELQQERQKTVALTSELTTARSDFETMAELASKAADKAAQPAELQQERQKTAALTSELATTRRDFETKLASSSTAADEAAQLRMTAEAVTVELWQERQETAALTSELATARREIEMQSAQSRKATETVQLRQAEATESATLLEQEREKTTALAREVADARQELTASTAQHRQAIDEERARSAALASELETAQRAIETRAAQSQRAVDEALQQKQAAEATIEELPQSLLQEQKKTAALMQAAQAMAASAEPQRRTLEEAQARAAAPASERAGTQREIETQAAQSKMAVNGAVQKQTAESTVANLQQSPQQEHAEPLSSEMQRKLKAPGTLSRQKHDESAQLKPVPSQAKGSNAAGLLARAKALVGQGNIRAARDVLERAAETGSAQAAFALAETYDPNVLATWRTRGTRSDATKARDLYARAYEGGIKAAKDRSHALVVAGGERKPASWFGREVDH